MIYIIFISFFLLWKSLFYFPLLQKPLSKPNKALKVIAMFSFMLTSFSNSNFFKKVGVNLCPRILLVYILKNTENWAVLFIAKFRFDKAESELSEVEHLMIVFPFLQFWWTGDERRYWVYWHHRTKWTERSRTSPPSDPLSSNLSKRS